MEYPATVPVTVDKSHITVLGEKLYAESIELLRELVNNAFDADATEVRVAVGPERIAVEDDGAGMPVRCSSASPTTRARSPCSSPGSSRRRSR